ncbi:MAG: NusG domain II-containing protein [Oscillospiraceae bacterium]|nr:NusG domain II-containing protein [Oscillospiraceae bacterium]
MKGFFADKKHRADLIVIGAMLLLALVLWLVIGATRKEGGQVVVSVNGVETERHPLSVDGTYPLNGGSNILVISGGEAWLSEANCPDLLCVRQGKIRYTGQSIICLPNRLTVTVEGGEPNDVDFVVG